ncbi:hypothetical protein WOLCODRAFT_72344 [Wolfiporia cocos MD-104 SS10]|uniref:NAD(P)-binding protein n=1 Tax=Wolfiporia cocos (strain MD-104) TaxID=742152 RepID=A0A2H3JYR2_WOLCO|nr:hypothetical protein WOLCODRAFT_72344 [Wolfiporia cocos MD-104 SS10]
MGSLFSGLWNIWALTVQLFSGKSKFSTDQIPDLSGQVMIVTGGNVGIGKETIKIGQRGHQALLEHNAKVYMASRSKDKAETAIREFKEQMGKEAIFLELDLSSLVSARKAAEEFLRYELQAYSLCICPI